LKKKSRGGRKIKPRKEEKVMKRGEKKAEEGREIRRGKQKKIKCIALFIYISTCNSQLVQTS
jgi:hypothetical protein